MAKTYNLYFGTDAKPLEYYKPATVKKELQDFVDNPASYEQFLKDVADEKKRLEENVADLTQEKEDAEQEAKDLKTEKEELWDFIENELGYDDLDKARADLEGKKLPNILKDLIGSIKVLKEKIEKDKEDITFLNNQVAGMVGRNELKTVDKARKKAVQDLGNLQLKYDLLKNKTDMMLGKWGVANLDELDARIGVLDQSDKVKQSYLQHYGVNTMKKLDEDFIIKPAEDLKAERKKIKDAKTPFENIIKAVNKKSSVIFGDVNKKGIKKNMENVKNALGYATIDAISDQEDN